MNKYAILEKLRTLKPLLQEKYGISELALFGSYSRDEQTSSSDIDLLVDFSKPIGIEYLDVVYLIKEAFEDVSVEVVDKKAIKKNYYDRLKRDLQYA
jgi:predicted nucleotidyltransferase